ncbi:hypothetical protein B046DRAFT_03596 [Streptomyces sp. LamerLS-316]|uniref:hypothetical protein n=1 Tax=unclassified Streptomyces TaxID=2593676 RepID=UPI0008238A72|nr:MULTISPECIES: hypothetical protein [unclassified Streptomyces]MYQ38783.1 hypothetical protein [Streptomyces sp. SID4921]SCK39050.1 hypothetical protein B046DRAFT_03596 [Streptomyces sp. LamerLS-316]
MGVDAVLMRVEQPGTGPRRRRLTQVDVFVDEADLFARLCTASGLPMLSRVDPYGTLVLTAVEMSQLLSEIDATRRGVTEASQRAALDEVGRLARICQEDSSTELRLEGD